MPSAWSNCGASFNQPDVWTGSFLPSMGDTLPTFTGEYHSLDDTTPNCLSLVTAEKSPQRIHPPAPPALMPFPAPSPLSCCTSPSSSSGSTHTDPHLSDGCSSKVSTAPQTPSPSVTPTLSNPSQSPPANPPKAVKETKERRRAQNRKAQQAHRDRRTQQFKELVERVEELETVEMILRAENGELREEVMRLKSLLRTARLSQERHQGRKRTDSVSVWNTIQKHPLVKSGRVSVAVVFERLRREIPWDNGQALDASVQRINEAVETCQKVNSHSLGS